MSTSMEEAAQMAKEMRDEREADYELKEFRCYAISLACASVCTSLSVEEAAERLNLEHPTGIASQWKLSKDKTFANGYSHPCQCPDSPHTHMHYLFEC